MCAIHKIIQNNENFLCVQFVYNTMSELYKEKEDTTIIILWGKSKYIHTAEKI